MRSRGSARILAVLGGIAAFLVAILLLKLRNWLPLMAGGLTYFVLLSMLWPKARRLPEAPLPGGVAQTDVDGAVYRLGDAAGQLRARVADAPRADKPLIAHMADLIDRIREHHRANPEHVRLTRTFIRHALPRMVTAVSDYIALSRRSGPEHKSRLDDISARLEAFVPALERIDRACLENDLDALEISVEVLNDQLDRKR